MTGPRPVRPAAHRWFARRPLAAAAAVVGAASLAAVAGCGVPIDSEPRPIVSPTTSTLPTSTTTPEPGAEAVGVYFLDGERLVRQAYPVSAEPTIGDAIALVLEPPADSTAELNTAIPPGTRLRDLTIADDVVTIDLSSEINDIENETQKQAFAQLVFTALDSREVSQVRFLVDGTPIDAPTDDGNLGVVTAGDYDPPLNPW